MSYRPFAVLSLIALVFALAACAGNAPRPQPAAETVSVVTLNLYHDKADWPKRRIQIAETLGRLAPDAIVLQEVIQTATLPNQAEWLADQLEYTHHFVTVDPPGSSVRYGNALLTRHPVLRRDDVRLEPAADSRTAGLLRIEVRGQPLNLYATHLHHTAEGGTIRERQLADLMEFIARTAGDTPSILAGDFNVAADAPELAAVRARFGDSFGVLHPDASADTTTLNRAWFDTPRRIDHVFFEHGRFVPVSARILFTEPDAEGTWASDHHGLLSVFEFVPGADAH